MASIDTAERTAQTSTARDADSTMWELQRTCKLARFAPITLTADSDGVGDDIILGSLGCSGQLRPEECRFVGISGSVQGVFVLEKVSLDGTVTALTGNATLATDGTAVSFARLSGSLDQVDFVSTDYLQLTIGTATALAAGDVIEIELAYSTTNAK